MSFGFSGRLFRMIAVALAFAALSVFAVAQTTTDGAIGGTIYDPQGAVVPNATITVHNNATNAEQTAQTDASGNYRITRLQPAVYTVTVQAGDFAAYKAERVVVEVGSVTTLSPHLALSGSTASVDVTAETPAINTTSPDFAPVVNQVQVDNLPINGGRWSEFATLTPTVVNNANGFGLVSVRGQSVLLNNNTLDGADNNQAFFSEERGRTRAGYSSPKVAVQEFQVNTSNYSAEYGQAAGGVVNTVTKSGTNAIHGEAYFYDRDNSWGATNPFTTITQAQSGTFTCANPTNNFCTNPYKPTDVRKMTGIGIGGPIIKDRLFWFFTYDRFFHNFPGTAVPASPSAFFAAPSCNANNTGFNGAQCAPGTPLATFAQRLYGSNTTANDAAANTVWNNDLNALTSVLGPVPRTGDQSIFFPKLDWQISNKNRASVEVNRMRWASPAGIQTQATNNYGIRSFGNDYVKDTWIIGKFDTFFTPTMSNEARYQWARDFEYENPQTPTSTYEQNTFMTNPLFPGYTNTLPYPPSVVVNGLTLGTPTFLTRPKYPDERANQGSDTVTWIHGNHSLKFGGSIRHVDDVSQNLRIQFGSYTYSTLLAYFSDLNVIRSCNGAPCYTSSYQQAFGPIGFEFATDDLAGFAQDDWKFKPRLTLNLGLRYEYEMMPKPFLTNAAVLQTASLPKDRNNWGPRIGFAYDVTGDGKTSLRG
ncbi:MAG TPA: TonB-dependent receptor, partial [Terriglobales bacterium]|nr:TonB-dependent receptor [Terriglobales bacterium]